MKHPARLIILVIACGVATTYAIGMSFALWGPEPALVDSTAVTLPDYPELDDLLAAGPVVRGRQRFSAFGTTVRETQSLIESGSHSRHPDTVMLIDFVYEFGWPLRAIAYREQQFIQRARRGAGWPPTVPEAYSGDLGQVPQALATTRPRPRRLPGTPLLLGFVINTAACSLLAAMCVLGPRWFIRRRRARRGCCPDCGYPLKVSSLCPECGKKP